MHLPKHNKWLTSSDFGIKYNKTSYARLSDYKGILYN